MARCRICDVDHEADELSWDDCCKKCVDASEGLFDEEDEIVILDGTIEYVEDLDFRSELYDQE